jgi:hypothetical protein
MRPTSIRLFHSISALIPSLWVHVVLLRLSAIVSHIQRQDLPVVPAGHAEPGPSAFAAHALARVVPASERHKPGLES